MNERAIINIIGQDGASIGTGFFASRQYIITCLHVLDNANCTNLGQLVWYRHKGENRTLQAEFVAQNKQFDIAVLCATCESDQYVPVCDWKNIEMEQCESWGFPANTPLKAVFRIDHIFDNGKMQLGDANVITFGFSGAPVVYKDTAVGMITAAARTDTNQRLQDIAFGISAGTIIRFFPQYVFQEKEKQRENENTEKNLIKSLEEAFLNEKKINPSMELTEINSEFFPKAHFIPRVTDVTQSNPGSNKNGIKDHSITFSNALIRSRKNGEIHHLFICGIGGLGKTVMLLSHSWRTPVIYIPLRRLRALSIDEYIKKVTLEDDDDLWKAFKELRNKRLSAKPNFVLILDGLNEVSNSKRNDIYNELSLPNWKEKEGFQVIIASRYDSGSESLGMSFQSLQLEPLTKKQIVDYFAKLDKPVPNPNEQIWSVITTPLMLTLFVHGDSWLSKAEKDYPKVAKYMHSANNPGSIVFNYLQSEIMRYANSHQDLTLPMIAVLYIAPFIAYEYRLSDSFSISKQSFRRMINTAVSGFKTAFENDCVCEQILNSVDSAVQFNSADFYSVLTKNTCIFFESDSRIEFMHQHFRDALAALYLYEQVKVNRGSEVNMLNESFDVYLESFFSDYLASENEPTKAWQSIWGNCKDTMQSDSYLVSKLLNIYRLAFSEDLSNIDFSGLDLREVSLVGYKLSSSSKHNFVGAQIGDNTFLKAGHQMAITALSWNKTWDSFVTSSYDCSIRIWNREYESVVISNHNLHSVYIRTVQWCPTNENWIASAGDDSEIVLWERIDRKWQGRILAKCSSWITSLTWSLDGKYIVCGTKEGELLLLPLERDHAEYLSAHDKSIRVLQFIDGKHFLSASDDGVLRIWDSENSKDFAIEMRFENVPIVAANVVDNGAKLSVVTKHELYLVDLTQMLNLTSTHKQLFDFSSEEMRKGSIYMTEKTSNAIMSAAIRSYNDRDYYAVFCRDAIEIYSGEINVHDSYRFSTIAAMKMNEQQLGTVTCAAWNETCSQIVFGSKNGSLWTAKLLLDEETYDRLLPRCLSVSANSTVRCSAWNYDGRMLAAGYDDNSVRLWNVKEGRCLSVSFEHKESVKCIAWFKGQKNLFATGSDDGCICVWGIDSDSPIKRISLNSPVNCISWLAGMRLIAGLDNGGIVVWDIDNNNCFQRRKHSKRIYSVLVSDNDRYLLSAGDDDFIGLWELGNRITFLNKTSHLHKGPIRALAWDKNNSGFFSSSNDCSLRYRCFDPEFGIVSSSSEELPIQHSNFVYSLALSGDQQYIISGSTDSTICLWDVKSKESISVGNEHNSFVWNVSTSPMTHEGCFVASSSSDGTLRLWSIGKSLSMNASHSDLCLKAIPCVSLIGCDFSGTLFDNDSIKELIRVNGGIVDEN